VYLKGQPAWQTGAPKYDMTTKKKPKLFPSTHE